MLFSGKPLDPTLGWPRVQPTRCLSGCPANGAKGNGKENDGVTHETPKPQVSATVQIGANGKVSESSIKELRDAHAFLSALGPAEPRSGAKAHSMAPSCDVSEISRVTRATASLARVRSKGPATLRPSL